MAALKNSKERLVSAASNNTKNIRTTRIITRKQNWEEMYILSEKNAKFHTRRHEQGKEREI